MPRRILIADDDPRERDLLRECLALHADHVVAVASAAQLVRAFSPGAFDLVVVSMQMPEIDPLFVCEGLKTADPELAIFLVGGDPQRRAQALGWGASGVLGRPVDDAALAAWVTTIFECRQARAELARKNDELGRLRQERRDVLGALVHDLNNPLAIVQGNVQWSHERVAQSHTDLSDALADALEGLRRLRAMIETLSMVSHLDGGQTALRKQRIGILDLVDDALKAQDGRAKERRISLSLRAEGNADVDGDPVVLRRVVHSLIGDCLRRTPASGQVRLSVRSASGVEIRMANSGSAPTSPGSGPRQSLDLYFCKRAIEAHDGALDLEQTEDRECELVVRLPSIAAGPVLARAHNGTRRDS